VKYQVKEKVALAFLGKLCPRAGVAGPWFPPTKALKCNTTFKDRSTLSIMTL
jgi:hypothetical protein